MTFSHYDALALVSVTAVGGFIIHKLEKELRQARLKIGDLQLRLAAKKHEELRLRETLAEVAKITAPHAVAASLRD